MLDEQSVESFEFAPYMNAGIGSRWLAQLVDNIIALVILILSALVFSRFMGAGITTFVTMASYIGYILFNDALSNGQSFGKKLLKIRVIDRDTGNPCSPSQSFLRNITAFIPIVNLIDVLMLLFGENSFRLGDRIAKTAVVLLEIDASKLPKGKAYDPLDGL